MSVPNIIEISSDPDFRAYLHPDSLAIHPKGPSGNS